MQDRSQAHGFAAVGDAARRRNRQRVAAVVVLITLVGHRARSRQNGIDANPAQLKPE